MEYIGRIYTYWKAGNDTFLYTNHCKILGMV